MEKRLNETRGWYLHHVKVLIKYNAASCLIVIKLIIIMMITRLPS